MKMKNEKRMKNENENEKMKKIIYTYKKDVELLKILDK
jgi:hypothetical protein